MLSLQSNLKPTAICWDSQIFLDLQYFFNSVGHHLYRQDPVTFLEQGPNADCQYINLITKDMSLRKTISERLGDSARFNFIHDQAAVDPGCFGQGCMIYPFVGAYNCHVGDDVICWGHNALGHGCYIGQGCVIGGGTIICGSVRLGAFCQLFSKVVIYDHVQVSDGVTLAAGSIIRKSIGSAGAYITTSKGSLRSVPSVNRTGQ